MAAVVQLEVQDQGLINLNDSPWAGVRHGGHGQILSLVKNTDQVPGVGGGAGAWMAGGHSLRGVTEMTVMCLKSE